MLTNITNKSSTLAQTTIAEDIVLTMSCTVAISANVFVMALILKVRQLKTSTNVFVFSLCLCNTMISLFVIPMRIFIADEGVYQLVAYKYVVLITILIYVCNLTAVSRHRLLCITEPMTYVQTQTKRDVMKIVAIMWTLPLIYCLLPLIWFKIPETMMSGTEILVHKIYKLVTLVLLLSPLFFMVFVFMTVYEQAKHVTKYERGKSRSNAQLSDSGTPTSKLEGDQASKCVNFGCEPITMLLKLVYCSAMEKYREKENISDVPLKIAHALPEVLLIAPSPELHSKRNSSYDESAFERRELAKDQEGNLEALDLSKFDSQQIESIEVNESKEDKTKSFGAISGRVSDATDNSTSFCLSPEYLGDMVQHARTVSMASLSSITSSFSTASLSHILRQKVYELKASLAFFIVAIVYMITWIPVIALTFIEIVDSKVAVPRNVEVISLYTVAFNALVDPFVYGLLLPNFRRTLKLWHHRRVEKRSISKKHDITE